MKCEIYSKRLNGPCTQPAQVRIKVPGWHGRHTAMCSGHILSFSRQFKGLWPEGTDIVGLPR